MGGLTNIKCIAFDCFGTLFDMTGVSRDEIKAYVEHVRKDDFTPYEFPKSWMDIPVFKDVAWGIRDLRRAGYKCWALSNGSLYLLSHIAIRNFVELHGVVDLVKHRVYKPHVDAYRTIEIETGFKPEETLMVTANPTFGDIEGAAAIGMPSQVIRHGYPNTVIELAEMLLKAKGEA
jgi:FMN phosphatase YigB (HAD superfamily)